MEDLPIFFKNVLTVTTCKRTLFNFLAQKS